MPYRIIQRPRNREGRQWTIFNLETRKTKSHHATKAKAEEAIKVLRAIEHGWKPPRRKPN
jgi:hypothetical protein